MELIKKLSRNLIGIDYVVGDIHGAFNSLYDAMDTIGFNPEKDRLISVGDLVDRGADSIEYWRLLKESWFHAVRGNHEDMAIKHFKGLWPSDNYIQNGGSWNFYSTIAEQTAAADDFSALPFMIEIETSKGIVGVIHANTRGDSWRYMRENIILPHVQEHSMWSRDRIWTAKYVKEDTDTFREYEGSDIKHIRAVIVGHTPNKKVIKIGNVYHIDTGGWHKGVFTFMNAETLEFVQA